MHIRGIHSFPEFVLRVNKCEEGCPRVAVRRWEQRMPPSPVLKKVSLGQKPLPAEGTGAQRQPSNGVIDGCLPEGRETVWKQVSTWALFPLGTGQSRQSSGVSARWQTDQGSSVLPKAKHPQFPSLFSHPPQTPQAIWSPGLLLLSAFAQAPAPPHLQNGACTFSRIHGHRRGSLPITLPPLQG